MAGRWQLVLCDVVSEFKVPDVVQCPKHWRIAEVEKYILLQPPLSADLSSPVWSIGRLTWALGMEHLRRCSFSLRELGA